MLENRIDVTLTAEALQKAHSGLAMINEALPFLIELSNQERINMLKFGGASRSFVVKGLAVAESHPEILPRSVNVGEYRRDVEVMEGLYPLLDGVKTLNRKLEDTCFTAGSEAYARTLLLYQYAKVHNINTGGLEEALDDLGRRFARKAKKDPDAAQSEPPDPN